MPLRIACDLDDTVAEMASALQCEAERLFGPGVDLRAAMSVTPELPSDANIAKMSTAAMAMERRLFPNARVGAQ